MSIIDKVCGKMGLMDPEEDKLDVADEELGQKPERKREPVEEEMEMSHEIEGARKLLLRHALFLAQGGDERPCLLGIHGHPPFSVSA